MKKSVTIGIFILLGIVIILLVLFNTNQKVEVPPFPESAGGGLGYVIAENSIDENDFVETVNGSTILHLEKGWNMISFTINPVEETPSDRSITINQGWNLIGYSSEFKSNISQDEITVDGLSVSDAVEKGLIQNQFAYYESNDETYKLVPSQNDRLRKNRGYWVYSNKNVPIEMTFKGVGGSLLTSKMNIDDLIFVDSNGTEKNFYDARPDFGIQIRRYDSSAQGFVPVNDGEEINPWEGYFINTRDKGISIKIN